MSSFSISSEVPSRRHAQSVAGFHQRHRNVFSKVLKPKTLREEIQAFYARQVEGIPYIPSYLQNTVYAQLLEQQSLLFKKIPHVKLTAKSEKTVEAPAQKVKWRFVFKADGTVETIPIVSQEEYNTEHFALRRSNEFYGSISALNNNSNNNNNNNSSSSSSSINISSNSSSNNNSPLSKAMPSQKEYAALETLLQENFNYSLASQDLRLPTSWNPKTRGDNIELGRNCLQLTYQGPGKDDVEASSIKANHSVKKQCGIYYFEVQIVSKGVDGHIGIGLCRNINSLDRLPGWEEHSWGYYGHNGHISSGPGTEKPYGPRFSTGDVVGCGIDFRDMSAFYTKNGVHLGTAFKNIKDANVFPFIGFKTTGEKVMTNFGSKPFKFDVRQYVLNEKRNLIEDIATKPAKSSHSQSTVINDAAAKSLADKLVLDYLRHHGYSNSAYALEKRMSVLNKEDESMDEDEPLDIDYIRRQEIRQLVLEGDIDNVIEICNQHYPNVLSENICILFNLKCRKFLNMVQAAAEGKKAAETMTTDYDEYEAESLVISNNDNCMKKRINTIADVDSFNCKKKKLRMHTDDELEPFREVMAYGNELKREYEETAKENSTIKEELTKTFSTLAYSDLSDPTIAYLFETSEKENLALKLNSAILVSLNRYPNSSIERIYRQTSTIIGELVLGGNAKAALLEPESDYLNSYHR
ncbi:hypothetical protein G6F62_000538 [Rhizopus arrhizus]|nr:hypothetical protein G6F62_000538 [Rhizopus arrhizus]